mgnify:CR=1 FL=1
MSDTFTEHWLEAAKEHFEEALKTENWAMCRAVIGHLKDSGYAKQAVVLEESLVEAQNPHEGEAHYPKRSIL